MFQTIDLGRSQASVGGTRSFFLDTILCYRLLEEEFQTGYISFRHVRSWKEFFLFEET